MLKAAIAAALAEATADGDPTNEVAAVLGPSGGGDVPSYWARAMDLAKTAYRIPDGLYNALGQLGGKAAQWVPNRMFLDKLIETGKAFLWNSDPRTAKNPSWNWTEFTYLLEKGYKLWYDGKDYFQSLTQLFSTWTEVK